MPKVSSFSLFWIILPVLLVSTSCASGEERLCHADEFFCQGDWPYKVQQLSTARLYELNQKHEYTVRRGSRPLEEEFGRRGQEALAVLTSSYSEKYFNYYIFSGMVFSIRSMSDIDGCQDPHYGKLLKFLRDFPDRNQSDKSDLDSEKFEKICNRYRV